MNGRSDKREKIVGGYIVNTTFRSLVKKTINKQTNRIGRFINLFFDKLGRCIYEYILGVRLRELGNIRNRRIGEN